ncbi:MAG: hypothetical protein ACOCV8_01575 [Spirochaetota bacterium]
MKKFNSIIIILLIISVLSFVFITSCGGANECENWTGDYVKSLEDEGYEGNRIYTLKEDDTYIEWYDNYENVDRGKIIDKNGCKFNLESGNGLLRFTAEVKEDELIIKIPREEPKIYVKKEGFNAPTAE